MVHALFGLFLSARENAPERREDLADDIAGIVAGCPVAHTLTARNGQDQHEGWDEARRSCAPYIRGKRAAVKTGLPDSNPSWFASTISTAYNFPRLKVGNHASGLRFESLRFGSIDDDGPGSVIANVHPVKLQFLRRSWQFKALEAVLRRHHDGASAGVDLLGRHRGLRPESCRVPREDSLLELLRCHGQP
jgi:hypothetical protein